MCVDLAVQIDLCFWELREEKKEALIPPGSYCTMVAPDPMLAGRGSDTPYQKNGNTTSSSSSAMMMGPPDKSTPHAPREEVKMNE